MKDETAENGNPNLLNGQEGDGDEKEELSIREFIERKKLQNKILAELIEKITNPETPEKPGFQDDLQGI
jgi:hypothetical protein